MESLEKGIDLYLQKGLHKEFLFFREEVRLVLLKLVYRGTTTRKRKRGRNLTHLVLESKKISKYLPPSMWC
jgi:hypothetical protein